MRITVTSKQICWKVHTAGMAYLAMPQLTRLMENHGNKLMELFHRLKQVCLLFAHAFRHYSSATYGLASKNCHFWFLSVLGGMSDWRSATARLVVAY
jgi:hypothetical protein